MLSLASRAAVASAVGSPSRQTRTVVSYEAEAISLPVASHANADTVYQRRCGSNRRSSHPHPMHHPPARTSSIRRTNVGPLP